MKLYRDEVSDLQLVTSYDATHLGINRESYTASLIVMPDKLVTGWAPGGFDALTAADFQQIRALDPALVLIGTGARQRFPKPALLRALIEAQIGYEVMDTGSACRTYNILASEGRVVAAALLLDAQA
ncbi:Mth938-like domain-containing protein [Uliginosibacterium sediminicola]|uniref:Mth938-like domain-containing protein n=1 Tax=Uliginosibacterium sediminicola TaxID=2024550 RepID=A0ABU9YYZ1_9RHOO